MPKPCNYEGCKFPRFSKGFCKRHQPKKPFVYKENKKPSNLRQPVQKALQITSVFRGVRKRIRKITAKQAIKNKEKAKLTQEDFLFYLGIWEQRPHICYNCECYLGEEPLSLFFDHILEKGLARYAHLRHVEDNICLLCWQCHTNKSMIKKLIILREETIKKLMMTKEEYVEAIKKVEQECEKAKKILVRSYAMSNNPYKIGDVIKDHTSTIKIDTINVYMSLTDPCCVYSGPELKKDGTPKLPKRDGKQIRATIYQSNIQK